MMPPAASACRACSRGGEPRAVVNVVPTVWVVAAALVACAGLVAAPPPPADLQGAPGGELLRPALPAGVAEPSPPPAPVGRSGTISEHPVTSAAVLEALAWSFVAGASTGVGGLVVLCVRTVGGALNSFLLGQAAGVMIALSVLDMLLPNIEEHGVGSCAVYFAAGCAAILLLARWTDGLDDWAERIDSSGGGGNGSSGNGSGGGGGNGSGASGGRGSPGGRDSSLSDGGSGKQPLAPGSSFRRASPTPPSRTSSGDHSHHHSSHHKLLPTEAPLTAAPLAFDKQLRAKRIKGAILTTVALALHNAPEGLAVGVTSLQSSVQRKFFVAAAISLHNIPEGIACATAVFNAGGTRRRACFIATMSGMVEPVFAVLSVVVLGPFLTVRLIDLSLVAVAGVMVTVSVRELIPQAVDGSTRYAVAGLATGYCLVQAGLAMLHSAQF